MKKNITVDAEEISRFEQMAEDWWNPHGKFKPLHAINPLRLHFIRSHACHHFQKDPQAVDALRGLRAVDIGCGGGLIAEPMARMGATTTGIDASSKNIGIANVHAKNTGTDVHYRATTAEQLVEEGEQFDIVLALEVVEHVADVPLFLQSCAALVKPGGLLFMSTLNRTLKSYAFAIIGAEYVMRWLPRGTHDWHKFLRPSELILPLEASDMKALEMRGMVFNPIQSEWSLSDHDFDVNYLLVASKP